MELLISESFRRTNFLLLYSVIIMHILHMLKFATIPTSLSCIYYSIVCIYVGSTRSLIFYNVKKENNSIKDVEGTEIASQDNSLMSLKTALSIPVIATGSLLLTYLAIINKVEIVNGLLTAYFSFLAVVVLKKYLYAYS